MPQLGPLEILVIFVVALVVFGPQKLPEIGRQVGRGIREFRRVQEHLRSELDDVLGHDDEPAVAESGPTSPDAPAPPPGTAYRDPSVPAGPHPSSLGAPSGTPPVTPPVTPPGATPDPGSTSEHHAVPPAPPADASA